MEPFNFINFLNILLFLLFSLIPTSITTNIVSHEKLDQTTSSDIPDVQVKCGSCPCVNPCALPSPPPPPPKTTTTTYCPPDVAVALAPPPPRFTYVTTLTPPPPRFIYVTAVPGAGDNLYVNNPYDNWDFYSSANSPLLNTNTVSSLLLLVVYGLVHFMIVSPY